MYLEVCTCAQETTESKEMAKITDMMIRKLEGEKGKTQKITIGAGLQLWVTINQSGKTAKVWYLRYYDASGKQQRSKLGTYPDMTLAKAMAAAEDAKTKAKEGVKLADERAAARRIIIEANTPKPGTSFEEIARIWLEKKSIDWEFSHAKRQRERLEANIFPIFGHKPISEITMPDIDAALSLVVNRGSRETAHRIATILKTVFEYADAMGFIEDISIITRLASYKKTLPQPKKDRHFYKDMTESQIGKLLLDLEESKARWTLPTSIAVRLAPYVITRPKELCEAEWTEVNLDAAEWFIPGDRMKAGYDHIVPLCRQALELFREIHKFSGNGKYVFPSWSRAGTPITTNALIRVFRKLGYESTQKDPQAAFTTHGFRGMASTILYQKLTYPGDFIEYQLGHVETNRVKAAYNRLTPRSYLEERRAMMQQYADYLDGLRQQAQSQ